MGSDGAMPPVENSVGLNIVPETLNLAVKLVASTPLTVALALTDVLGRHAICIAVLDDKAQMCH